MKHHTELVGEDAYKEDYGLGRLIPNVRGTISYTGGVKSGKEKTSKCRHRSVSPLQEGIPSALPSPPHHLENPQESQPQVPISYLVPGIKR